MQPHGSQAHWHGLPPNPNSYTHAGTQSTGSLAAHAVTVALSNPYARAQYAHPQASHYAQAYAQYYNQPGPSSVTAEGYTLSSMYNPNTQRNATQHAHSSTGPRPQQNRPGGSGQSTGWYQPGNCRCSKQGCSFTGSKKSVETHMMDRHLIYPPGWEHRKRRNDWDADPSLRGKPVPIQGTSIRLDTPEAIAGWIAERKKRFPTAQNIAEKESKMREAVERGQLPFEDGSRRKRRRMDNEGGGERPGGFKAHGEYRGPGRGRGRGRGRGGFDGGGGGRRAQDQPMVRSAAGVEAKRSQAGQDVDNHTSSDSDGAPEIVSSKPLQVDPRPEAADDVSVDTDTDTDEERVVAAQAQETNRPAVPVPKKPRLKQPRRLPYNPFAQRPSLLRNLLLPEVRVTVSNFSQAIRFLVDNDFLDNVELKPGQANQRMIEVIGEQPVVNI